MRRILRRAIRYGRSLGFHEPFFFKLVDVVAKTMGDVFPEIRAKQETIKDVIRREEGAFNKTLDMGIQEFFNAIIRSVNKLSMGAGLGNKMIIEMEPYGVGTHKGSTTNIHDLSKPLPTVKLNVAQATALDYDRLFGARPRIGAEDAFKLYDTYGFPLDLTELMARERGLTVDVTGFERLMEEQRHRARKAQKKEEIGVAEEDLKAEPTKFLGYDFLETESVVETVLPGKNRESSTSSSIERRFTPRWADKWEIADCFMYLGKTVRKSVSCA